MDAQKEACDTYTACANTAQEWIEEAPLASVCVGLAAGLATGLLVGTAMSRHESGYTKHRRETGNLATRLGSQFLNSMEEAAKSGYSALQTQFGGH
ncbi:hypothetical protein [Botrimarina mediterranea]|uniref:Uncharacterized protein n=1 Tax=Botrimarina mediterranea TaxID=2528022 RepID=A0A518K3D1_9BACT|nr:hypothetical protein [Botrimarina mediterranea]QDV72255.1 hypothetical protein Spa11_04280 [Botrimarina mediterranea]QDV76799.1 hypothetical protein K2D_03810 [Planctomycetes bacterium K2D]